MKFLYKSAFLALILTVGFGIGRFASAQDAIESTAELDKVEHPVFTTTFPYAPKIVEGALLQKLQKDHIRAKQRRHTITCKAVVYPALSNEPLDLYFQIDGKSKKGEGSTTLHLFISKGRDNFIGEKYDEDISEKALYFLNHFRADVNYYALQQEIKEKESDLEDARDDYKKRLEDKQDLNDDLYKRKKALSAATGKDIKKTKRKINKINKKIRRSEDDINDVENKMQQLKGEIQALRNRLSGMERW